MYEAEGMLKRACCTVFLQQGRVTGDEECAYNKQPMYDTARPFRDASCDMQMQVNSDTVLISHAHPPHEKNKDKPFENRSHHR